MNKNKQQVIGSKVLVDFPELDISNVPAKIDTGADSSSLWVSNLKKEGSEISFNLFGKDSPYYTGQTIKTDKFTINSVKNSFGHSEVRYKIDLKVKIRDRKIKARFTLADRSRSKYSILIGRRTIKGKFLVDVSEKWQSKEEAHILVLIGKKRNKNVIKDKLEDMSKKHSDIKFELVSYKDVIVEADSNDTRISIISNGRDVASYDYIYFLSRNADAELAAMTALYAKRRGVSFSDKAAIMTPPNSKAYQALAFSNRGVATPETMYVDIDAWEGQYKNIKDKLGTPFIFKDNNGHKGKNNFLIKSKKDLNQALKSLPKINPHTSSKQQMVAQKFIPNNGYYRALVMGGVVVHGSHRSIDIKKSHLFDSKINGLATELSPSEIPPEAQEIAIRAAELTYIDVAGVDIVRNNEDGEWYCLEVNSSPQIASGLFTENKLKGLRSYFKRELSK